MIAPESLSEWPAAARSRIAGVFTDIDDTLTTGGRVPAAVFGAIERLQDAGLLIVPVTGRPAGWCDLIARAWPVDAVVGENGALAFRYDGEAKRMMRLYADSAPVRAAKRQRLERVRDAILDLVPGARVSADQSYRETDLAIDIAEDVPRLRRNRRRTDRCHIRGPRRDRPDKLDSRQRLVRRLQQAEHDPPHDVGVLSASIWTPRNRPMCLSGTRRTTRPCSTTFPPR